MLAAKQVMRQSPFDVKTAAPRLSVLTPPIVMTMSVLALGAALVSLVLALVR